MKTLIKILIIVLVAGGIAAAIWAFFHKIDGGVKKSIATTEYEKRIEAEIQNRIPESTGYSTASSHFDDLMCDIITESRIKTTEGDNVITEDEYNNCEKMLTDAYLPIFTDYSTSYFTRSTWDENEIFELSKKASTLMSLNSVGKNSNLTDVVNNVENYKKAKSVIASSGKAYSVSEARRLMNEASTLNNSPLSNNTKIKKGLQEVPSKAKESIVRSIGYAVDRTPMSEYSYSRYDQWLSQYEKLINRINEYTNAFGSNSTLSQCKKTLNDADRRIETYFAQKANY